MTKAQQLVKDFIDRIDKLLNDPRDRNNALRRACYARNKLGDGRDKEAYNRAYYAKNKDKIRARSKAHYAKDRVKKGK